MLLCYTYLMQSNHIAPHLDQLNSAAFSLLDIRLQTAGTLQPFRSCLGPTVCFILSLHQQDKYNGV